MVATKDTSVRRASHFGETTFAESNAGARIHRPEGRLGDHARSVGHGRAVAYPESARRRAHFGGLVELLWWQESAEAREHARPDGAKATRFGAERRYWRISTCATRGEAAEGRSGGWTSPDARGRRNTGTLRTGRGHFGGISIRDGGPGGKSSAFRVNHDHLGGSELLVARRNGGLQAEHGTYGNGRRASAAVTRYGC
jgi:hypothetical protein